MTPKQLTEHWDAEAETCTTSAESTRSLSLYERELERARTLSQCAMQLRLVLGLEVRHGS
jgi:hypothetical protein